MNSSYVKIMFPSTSGYIYTSFAYPDGCVQTRLSEEGVRLVRRYRDVTIEARLTTPSDLINLIQLCDAIREIGYERYLRIPIYLYLPYLSYSRADRRFCEGDCDGLGVFLNILRAADVASISTLDVHNPVAIAGKGVEVENIPALPLIQSAISRLDRKNLTILFPDEGASRRYDLPDVIEGNCGRIKLRKVYATKVRDEVTGKLLHFTVPYINPSEHVLIVDDICDGGGTFLGIASLLNVPREQLALYVTHGLFSKGLDSLCATFGRIFCSDSIQQKDPRLNIIRYGWRPEII